MQLLNFDLLSQGFNPIYPNAAHCDSKKNIVVTLMRAVATEIGQYTLPYCIQLYKSRLSGNDCCNISKYGKCENELERQLGVTCARVCGHVKYKSIFLGH